MRWLPIVVLCVAACGKGKEPRFEGPMPVTFGACAGPTTTWVSGPRPLPFTPQAADGPWLAAGKTATKAAAKPPVAKPDDDGGGTGTAMALDEGKMGTPDKQGSASDDPQLARQQAIQQARAAGILGSVSGAGNRTSVGGPSATDDSGFGATGGGDFGGTGWGTIGTGEYGTIGHGTATGAGYGNRGGNGLRGRTNDVPTVSVGQPAANGDLDKAIIRRYIRRNISKIQYCYEKQLLVKPTLHGTVQAQFFITLDGTVASSNAAGVDPDVASCVAEVIKEIEFPKPRGGGGVQVNYPFTFRVAGDSSTSVPPAAPPQAGSGTPPPVAEPPPPPPPATTPPTPSQPRERELFRSADAEYVDPTHYVPGSDNPLVDQEPALVECFRRNPKHYGAVVVELHFDAAGTVTTATANGLDSESATACVVAAAKLAKRGASAATAERCSLAFGEMAVTDLPTIDLTEKSVTYAGKEIATTASIIADDTKVTKLADLQSAIAAQVQAALAAKVVSLHGPIVVRPVDSTPMKVVVRALGSVIAAGDDFILERKQGAAWELLYKETFPVVPVPIGTGGKWNPVKGQSRLGGSGPDDEHVVLSLLITKQQAWVGVSRIDEFMEVPRNAAYADKLEATLKEQKASAFFADRSDIEIAADDDVPYSDVLAAIDLARKVGFVDWELTDPPGLAARPSL